MKTYEEMASNVLKRRDEELQKAEQNTFTSNNEPPEKVYPASGKRLLPRIAIPCASVVTAAAVGLTVWHNVSPGENKGEYQFSEFKGSRYATDEFAVIIDETTAPRDRDYSDVYKGGKTEINYNVLGDFCPYVWCYKNINEPTYKDSDFVSISDINYFYGIKFDRLNEVLGEGKHDPFGYHTQDVESDGVVSHSVRGYYNVNTIHYVAYDGLGGFSVTVSASFEKLTNAGELYSGLAPEIAKNPKPSVINGFDALVYNYSGQIITEIDMNGVYVTISAEPIDDVYRDTEDYENFKKLYESYLTSYTAPISGSSSTKTTEFHILDEMPQIVRDNDPFKPIDNAGVEFMAMTIEEINSYYNIEFNRLGNLHSDWNERGRDKLGIYYKDYPSFETSNSAMAGGRDIPTGQINTLEYDIPNGKCLRVSAVIGTIPGILYEDGEAYRNSYVNGLNAVIYRHPKDDCDLGAMVQIGNTVVEFSSKHLSDEEFEDVLREFTEKNGVEEVHYGNPNTASDD